MKPREELQGIPLVRISWLVAICFARILPMLDYLRKIVQTIQINQENSEYIEYNSTS